MKEISENAKKLLIENLEKLPETEKLAKSDNATLKEILEYFIIKDNIASLRLWGTLPEHSPIEQITIDFSETEKILGFEIHPELKEFLSLYFSYIEGIDGREPSAYSFQIGGTYTPNVLWGFDKSDTKDDFICKGHFCNIGFCNMGAESELEFDNDTGAVYAWDFEAYTQTVYKIADSIHEFILTAESIWSCASEDELFPLEDLYEK